MRRALLLAVLSAGAFGPVALLLVTSFASGWYWPALLPREWTPRAWAYVFSAPGEVRSAMALSTGIAAAAAAICVILALPAGRSLARGAFPGRRFVLALLLLPVVVPPVASTMGLHRMLLFWNLTDTAAGVTLAHVVPALPYAVLAITGSFRLLDPDMERQAQTLGATRLAIWRHVTLPAIAPGLAVAFTLAFLISWSQYLLTLLIGGGLIVTLPLEMVGFQRAGDDAIAAALSVVFLLPVALLMVLSGRFLRR